jgi:ABC transporter
MSSEGNDVYASYEHDFVDFMPRSRALRESFPEGGWNFHRDIESLRHSAISRLSSGQIVRVNLCKALLNDPELLLLDEPTAYLDTEIADRIRQIVIGRRNSGAAVVYTSHNMAEIETMCELTGQIVCYLNRTYRVLATQQDDAVTMKPESRDALLTAIAKARGWIDDIRLGRIASFAGIAEREAVSERHIRLLAPLAFLSPRIIAAIADGTAPADLTVTGLAKALPYSWAEQERAILRNT